MMRTFAFLLALATLMLVGCSQGGDTVSGTADTAAGLAKKSEGAPPLPSSAQAELGKMRMPGGKK